MSLPVIILGGGGHAKVLIETLRASGVTMLGITDADRTKQGHAVTGVTVLGDDSVIAQYGTDEVLLVNGIGSVGVPHARRAVFDAFKAKGYSFASVIHPSAVIAADVALAEGAQVMAGAVIQPCCSIGRNSIVNTCAVVDHDCVVGDHVHLSPGAVVAGSVRIGSGTHVGAGATVIQGIAVGSGCLVAAGAVVVADVPDGRTVRGVPAKEVRP